eukprot:COSAG04_NODE_1793_length_5565_cov_52.214782_1_plen_79_part_00
MGEIWSKTREQEGTGGINWEDSMDGGAVASPDPQDRAHGRAGLDRREVDGRAAHHDDDDRPVRSGLRHIGDHRQLCPR